MKMQFTKFGKQSHLLSVKESIEALQQVSSTKGWWYHFLEVHDND